MWPKRVFTRKKEDIVSKKAAYRNELTLKLFVHFILSANVFISV